MGSPLCDDCNTGRAIVHCRTHLARLCFQCNLELHSSITVDNHDQSRFLLCNNCVLPTAVDQGLCLCQTCVSNANVISDNNLNYSSPLDLDSSSSSSSSNSFIDFNRGFSFVSLPFNNMDSSSSSGFFQNFDNYTKNYIHQQVSSMSQPHFLDITKDSSCSGFINGYETKEDIHSVWLNNLDRNQKEYFLGEDLILTDQLIIDEITKHNAETTPEIRPSSSSGMSSVIQKDYNIETLVNGRCQDYNKNQMIGSKPMEEMTNSNNLAIFPNVLVQLDCGSSQLILTDEMLPWEDQTRASKTYNSIARKEALKRYFAKKMKRKFGKQIRYKSRKSTADTKKRMKGRFTKAGAEYDYDPRANNTKRLINHELIKR